jgi:ribosomal peptide maturation radical SAM protein 1
MHKIFLINMPFAILNTPSIALTQLKSVLDDQFEEQVSVKVLYLNLDFAHYMGVSLYQYIAFAVEGLVSGIGDWFFRQSAFPELVDNAQEYFSRYYSHPGKRTQVLKYAIQKKRQGVDDYLDELIAAYGLDQATIVGFTSRFSQNLACLAMARKLKERNPDIITVMGGPNCQSPMGQEIVRHVPQIDFVFSGPALTSFPEFFRHFLDQNLEACECIDGVFSKTNFASFPTQATLDEPPPIGVFGQDLDINADVKLDYAPFLEAFERHFPDEEMKPILLFETSRGCWWGERVQCRFCGISSAKMPYSVMSPEKAIKQFESLFKYPRPLYLHCVDNILPKSLTSKVLSNLDVPSDVVIYYSAKALLNEQDVQTLSRAGVKIVQLEIEALTTSALKSMKTGSTALQNVLCLKNCLFYGVYPVWNFLVGFPGEEEEMHQKHLDTIPLLAHLPPPSGVQTVAFERYSPYFVNAQEYELDLHPDGIYRLLYPFDEEVLENLAYHFTNHNFKAPYLIAMYKWIDKIRDKCYVWQTRWHGQDQALPPRLFFEQKRDLTIVYDSRSEEAVEHHLDQIAIEMLKYLDKPRSLTQLAEAFGHIQGLDATKEITSLQDRGLVFEENGRFLSLVLPGEPAPLNAQTREYLSFLTPFVASFSTRRY